MSLAAGTTTTAPGNRGAYWMGAEMAGEQGQALLIGAESFVRHEPDSQSPWSSELALARAALSVEPSHELRRLNRFLAGNIGAIVVVPHEDLRGQVGSTDEVRAGLFGSMLGGIGTGRLHGLGGKSWVDDVTNVELFVAPHRLGSRAA